MAVINYSYVSWQTDYFNMYIPFIELNSSFPNEVSSVQAYMSTHPTPTYFISDILMNINNGLNVEGAINKFAGTNFKTKCHRGYELSSEYNNSPYYSFSLTEIGGDWDFSGVFYGAMGENAISNPRYFLLIKWLDKYALAGFTPSVQNYPNDYTSIPQNFQFPQGVSLFGLPQIGSQYLTWDVPDFEETFMDETDPIVEIEPDRTPDPWEDDNGWSDTGGGGGASNFNNYTNDSENVPVPSLPTYNVGDSGFVTLYTPTIAQMKTLADYMWGNLFDITTFKKLFADPMDCILGLSILPFNVPHSVLGVVKVGNLSTGVNMNVVSQQYVEIDCGSITLNEQWHSYLDYSPYTKLSIFLPYIGFKDVDIDLVQGTTLGVKYHIDVLSGGCVAFITENDNVIAQYSGQCAVSIPITSNDFTQTIIALGTLVAGAVSGIASGGLSAPVSAQTIGGVATATANTANTVISSKPRIDKSGNLGGSCGLMGSQKPYLLLEIPRNCTPKNQNKYLGYPSYIQYSRLSNLHGFTQFASIKFNGVPCTDEERDELKSLFESGVII